MLHNDTLSPDETVVIRGLAVTTPARTAFDLGRRYGRTLAALCAADGPAYAPKLNFCSRERPICLQKFSFGRRNYASSSLATARTTSDTRRATLRSG